MHNDYEIAQICLNGHVVSCIITDGCSKENYCSKCGQAATMECGYCQEKIRGIAKTSYHVDRYITPAYCPNCGKPYPWTEATIKEFGEIVDMADELDDDERGILKESFPALLVDQPGSSAAAMKIAQLLKRAKDPTIIALKSAIASKLAGKALDLFPKLVGW